MICPSCNAEGQGNFCVQCGTALEEAMKTGSIAAKPSFWHVGILAYLIGGVALLVYTCIYYWN